MKAKLNRVEGDFFKILLFIKLPKFVHNFAVGSFSQEITCGSIINVYIVAFNAQNFSPDSHLLSIVVSHSVSPFLDAHEILVPNITSILLNLYPLNSNFSFCPVEKFSVALREWKSDWMSGKATL